MTLQSATPKMTCALTSTRQGEVLAQAWTMGHTSPSDNTNTLNTMTRTWIQHGPALRQSWQNHL